MQCPGQLTLTNAEIATFAESVKFADASPRGLLTRTIVARNFRIADSWEPAA